MNAPINFALLQRASAPAVPAQQPTVTPGTRVLVVGYEHDGVLLDLHGTLDAAGYEVTDVTLTGHDVALTAFFRRPVLLEFDDWCNRTLPSAHELRQVSAEDARIERMEWERNFNVERPPM
ncbi:hypothetical protein ASF61_06645 [Duganella sp. Leaf126]|uniref:hypothetical protein n=1 Tax=Duganella sp. Leaf126 TaxID=1736266 RepID=UPI0006F9652B|nr:hypothetical protein [Duganella sp. Leaf126]KQQ40426.1 hypothetical protein ASF61_06645 [Duganella sp. Leaf126]